MTGERPKLGQRALGYGIQMKCVGHEIALNSDVVAEAEILVAGYSFCYPCGNTALYYLLDGAHYDILEILKMFRDGVIEVAP